MTARQPSVEVTSTKAVYLEEGRVLPLPGTQCIYTGIERAQMCFGNDHPTLPGQVLFPGFDPGARSILTTIQQEDKRQREITEMARQNRQLWLLRSLGKHMDGVAGEYAEEENEMTEWWILEEALYEANEADDPDEAKIRYEDQIHEEIPLKPDTSYCITLPLYNKKRISRIRNDAPCDGESDNKNGKDQATRQESSDSEDDTSSNEKSDSDSKEAVRSVADPDCIITNIEPGFEVAPEIASYCDALEWAQIKQEPEPDDEMPMDSEVIVTAEVHRTTDDLVSPPPAKKRKLSGHLKIHMETVHEGKKKHVCDWTGADGQPCNRAFGWQSSLKRHIETIHEGKKEHVCNKTGTDGQPCNQTFGWKSHLKTHMKLVHEGKKDHVCDSTAANGQPCHQAFGLKGDLKRHIETVHKGKKEHICDWTGADSQPCNQAFGQKSDLKKHIETVHEGKKEHICDCTAANGEPCNQAFGWQSHLKRHIETIHKGKKEHVCDWTGANGQPCNQEFGQKSSLKTHIETVHEGKKEHICDWTGADGQSCNKAFGQKSSLKTHMETIHEVKKKYVCDWTGADGQPCNRAFDLKGNLKAHIEKVHEGKKKNKKHPRMEEADDQTADSQQHRRKN